MSSLESPVPQIRFRDFTDHWVERRIGDILEKVSDPVKVSKHELYTQIGIRSHCKGIFHKEPVSGESLGNKRVFWLKEDLFILNIVFAWEQAVAKTSKNEIGLVASHRFPMYKPAPELGDLDYLLYLFNTKKGKYYLELASPGGAGRNKTLGQKEFERIKILLPSVEEQQKIASFLSAVDKKIEQLKRKKQLLEQYKKGVMQQIFSQEIRFKDDDEKDYPEWEEKMLGDILEYEQPTKYIVTDTEYSEYHNTPVLTAGKSFILGYTNEENGIYKAGFPVIIFDDFTTDCKFVDFPFKVKSSAIKILKARSDNVNIKMVYELMRSLEFQTGGHKRHWISEYQNLSIPLPAKEEQNKIIAFIDAIDQKNLGVEKAIAHTIAFKKGLLQQMFV